MLSTHKNKVPRWKLCLFLAPLVFLLVIYTYAESKSVSILSDKPVFTLHIHGAGSAFFVQLNDVAVHSELSSHGQATLEIPINHWLRSGSNSMRIDVLPDSPGEDIRPHAEVSVDLKVHPHGNSDQEYSIAKMTFSGEHFPGQRAIEASSSHGEFNSKNGFVIDDAGDVSVSKIVTKPMADYEGAVSYERAVEMAIPLPVWKFFGSDTLPDYEAMSDEDYYDALNNLYLAYEKVQQALESGDIDSVVSMLDERNRETDAAYYLEPGTTEAGIRKDLVRATTNSNMELAELKPDYVGIIPEENRKLVSLTRSGLGAAIGFDYKNMEASERFHFIFRREGDKWIISR